MPTVTVEHPDGSTETIPETTEWTRTRELNKMRRAVITVERSLARAVSLTRKRDRIQLGNIDDLVLVDIETGGSTWDLVCYSDEWLANRYQHLAGGTEKQGTDDELFTDLIGDVSEWSEGTISSFTGPMTYVFNHAHRHDALRRIERNVPGELRFRDRGTIDYVQELGDDKSDSLELSSAAGNLEQSISITERGRQLDGTHIRVLGTHEGEAQIFANLVPDADPQSYENEVRYTSPRWDSAEDTDWDRWTNKEVSDQETIYEEAESLGEELKEELVEAKAIVSGVDLTLGDYVQVVKDDADLDRRMRVHRIKTVSQGATVRDELLLSTRTTLRRDDSEQLRDIQQWNTGFQGSSVWSTVGPMEQNVDVNEPLEMQFYYPNIEFENKAELFISSEPYRYYVTPVAHDHDVTIPFSNLDHFHDVDIPFSDLDHFHDVDIPFSNLDHDHSAQGHEHTVNDITAENTEQAIVEDREELGATFIGTTSWSIADSFSITSPTSAVICYVSFENSVDVDVFRFRLTEGINTWPITNGVTVRTDGEDGQVTVPIFAWGDFNGSSIDLEVKSDNASSATLDIVWNAIGTHEHNLVTTTENVAEVIETQFFNDTIESSETEFFNDTVQSSETEFFNDTVETSDTTPGVDVGVQTTAETASNVDVLVNGTQVASNIGTGNFTEQIDLRGDFTTGTDNLVEITTDSPGRFFATLNIDAYKQIGKTN